MPVLKRKNEQGQWEVIGGGGSNVEVDKTLSVDGMAADAKIVGDAIEDIKIYKQDEEPDGVPDGTLWLDMDEDTGTGSGSGGAGTPGEPGYTPIKGVDYWTEEDKAEMVQDVLAALPVYSGEVV